MQMSEARLNDLCYITLKRYFFGEMSPRQCDIRICMDLSAPKQRIKSPMAAILMPNEVAGTSHTTFYDVEPENVFDQCVEYMEDHWMKETVQEHHEEELEAHPEIVHEPDVRGAMLRDFLDVVVPNIMGMPEEECAVMLTKEEAVEEA